MRAAVPLAVLLLLSATPLALASEKCVAPVADRFEALPGLPGLPAGWTALLALDESRLPAIPRVVASGPHGLCEVTADAAAFARLAGVTRPEDRAALAVATAFPDHLGLPEVRELVLDGGIARVQTWSAKDGLVVDWVVDLASLRADFVVAAVGVGSFPAPEHGFEGWHPWVGFSSDYVRGLENGALITKTMFQVLPDGKQFKLTYMTQNYASEAQADQYALDYAAASLAIWTIENQQWGFASADPDGTYDITMDGCSCIFAGNNVNIHVHAKLESLFTLFNPPLSYPTFQHFYRIVIGHEWHHHLQYSINQWALGNYLTEGGARFSETVFEPEGAHGPNTIQYLPNSNGFSNMMLTTNVAPTGRSYDLGLFWGFLHGANGGIATIKKVYQEARNGGDLYAVITRALATSPGAHDSFEAVWREFAVSTYTKNFTWGGQDGTSNARDWGLYLPTARREAMDAPAPVLARKEGTVTTRGIVLVRVPFDADPMYTQYAGDQDILARWAWQTPTGPMLRPAGLTYTIADGPVSDPVLLLVRGPQVPDDVFERVIGNGKYQALVEAPGEAAPVPPLPV